MINYMLVLDVTLSWASFLLLILEVIMIKPSLDSVKALASGYDIVPVYMEILSDIRTPISVLKDLKKVRIIRTTGAVIPSWAMILSWKSFARTTK